MRFHLIFNPSHAYIIATFMVLQAGVDPVWYIGEGLLNKALDF